MATLRHGQRFLTVTTSKAVQTEEVSTDDIVELLFVFFFSNGITNVSGEKLAKIWPSFLSSLNTHGIRIPSMISLGNLFLDNGIRSMLRDGHLLSYYQGGDNRFKIELTDRKAVQIRECANEKLLTAVSVCALRALRNYKNLPNL